MKNIILILIATMSCSSISMKENNQQTIDYVPNKETAIKIAEVIWLPIYGESIYKKKPFNAVLIDNKVWRVQGSLNPEQLGGVPYIEINKKDCRIIKVTHGK